MKFITIFLFSIIYSGYLFSQACCSGGVPISGNLGLNGTPKGSLQFLLSYDHNTLKTLINESEILEDDTRTRLTQSILLEANYGLSDKITLTGLFSTVKQTRNIQFNTISKADNTTILGLGDAVLLLKYRLTKTNSTNVLYLGAGPKIPIGKTDYTNKNGLSLPADMQPGTGSWDAVFWGYYTKKGLIKKNFSVSILTTYRKTGTNNNYLIGNQTYKFGDEFQLNGGANYRTILFSYPIDVYVLGRFRSQKADLINAAIFPSTGGIWVDAIPGVSIIYSEQLSFRLSNNIPIYRKLTGTQLTTTNKFNIGIIYSPQKKSNPIINTIKYDS